MPTEYEYERECDNIDYIMCGEQIKEVQMEMKKGYEEYKSFAEKFDKLIEPLMNEGSDPKEILDVCKDIVNSYS